MQIDQSTADAHQLSDHQCSFLNAFLSVYDVKGKDVLEVGGAMPSALVLDYLGANSWTCIQSSEYAQYCNDNQIPSMHMMATRYFPIYANIEELLDDNRLKAKFDAVFSIACFEHLHKLPQALNVIYQALRPSGILFSMFAPIWSGPWGQHYTGTIPDRFDPIKPGQHWSTGDIFGPWDHLLMSRFKFFEHYKVKFDAAFSEELTYITYNSPQINRYYFEDYEHFFNQTKFHKKIFKGIFSLTQNSLHEIEIDNLRIKHAASGYSNFTDSGIVVLLQK